MTYQSSIDPQDRSGDGRGLGLQAKGDQVRNLFRPDLALAPPHTALALLPENARTLLNAIR